MDRLRSAGKKKRYGKIAALLLMAVAVVFLIVAVVLLSSEDPAEQTTVLCVNGEAVGEEEFSLCNKSRDTAVRNKVIQQWAVELGLADAFSYGDMVAEMESVNESQAQAQAAGEPVYGILSYSESVYYHMIMSEREQLIQQKLESEITEEELRSWYEENISSFTDVGSWTAIWTIIEADGTSSSSEVELNASNYRMMEERDGTLVMVLSGLTMGEESTWTDGFQRENHILCTSYAEGEAQPFEDVSGSAAQSFALERYEALLEERIASSTVQ